MLVLENCTRTTAATPCTVEKKTEDNARSDGRKGENHCETRTAQYDPNDAGDGDDKNNVQMTNDERDDVNDSQALTGGDITKYRALVARITYLSQDRPDPKFASVQVCCAMANPSVSDMELVKRIGSYLVGKPRAECLFHWQQRGGLEAYSDVDWRGDRSTRRSVSVGVITRGGHCLQVWTKKQQVVSLSTAESCHRGRIRIRRSGHPERGKGLGDSMWVEPTSGRRSDDVPSQPQTIGHSETR